MRELALFAGAGGGLLGSALLGWRTVCAVEINAYCRSLLLARQRDRLIPRFPIWDDVRSFDGRPWRDAVDVISGGFPCQDISSAGRRAGIEGGRSRLWSEFARIIGEVRPRFALVENSPDLTSRGLGVVLGDLASLGYDARWDVLGARHVGAPHKRDRIWILAAHSDGSWQRGLAEHAEVARAPAPGSNARDTDGKRQRCAEYEQAELSRDAGTCTWWHQLRFEGVANGVAAGVERTRATGNGQVPRVVELAWKTLLGSLMREVES